MSKTSPVGAALVVASVLSAGAAAHAALQPTWMTQVPVGAALTAGLQAMTVDPDGTTYLTGITGLSSNTDIVTAAVAPSGALLWSRTYDGPAAWHDQARGIARGPGGHLYVTGNTPGPNDRANFLLLDYDTATGDLLGTVQLPAGPFASEYGAGVVVDGAGNVYVAGGTTGDGTDVLLVSFDTALQERWRTTWDGPAAAPYSLDSPVELAFAPDGNLVLLVHGVMASLQPDYVVQKYAPANGALLWQATCCGSGGDYPADLEIDAAGDLFVTGTSIGQYATARFRGSDGATAWVRFDAPDSHNAAVALALDHAGGVVVTGVVDPDGDRSNSNDDIYTVRRDAATGDLLWSHLYGAPCVYCFDGPADLAVDAAGNVLLSATTSSPPYSGNEILFDLDRATGAELDRGVLAGTAPGEAAEPGVLRFDSLWNLYEGGALANYNTGELAISLRLWPSLVTAPAFADDFEDGTTAAWTAVVP